MGHNVTIKETTQTSSEEKKNDATGKKIASKKKRTQEQESEILINPSIIKEAGAVLLILSGLFALYSIANPPSSGNIGEQMGRFLNEYAGWASFVFPFLLIIAGSHILKNFPKKIIFFYPLVTIALIWTLEILRCLLSGYFAFLGTPGLAGKVMADILISAIGYFGSISLLVFLSALFTLLFTGKTFKDLINVIYGLLEKIRKKFAFISSAYSKKLKRENAHNSGLGKDEEKPEFKPAANPNADIEISDIIIKKTNSKNIEPRFNAHEAKFEINEEERRKKFLSDEDIEDDGAFEIPNDSPLMKALSRRFEKETTLEAKNEDSRQKEEKFENPITNARMRSTEPQNDETNIIENSENFVNNYDSSGGSTLVHANSETENGSSFYDINANENNDEKNNNDKDEDREIFSYQDDSYADLQAVSENTSEIKNSGNERLSESKELIAVNEEAKPSQAGGLENFEGGDTSKLKIYAPGTPILETQAASFVQNRYPKPSLNILADKKPCSPSNKPFKNYSESLIEKLESFGVAAEVSNVLRGPSVTRYELKLGDSVKVSKFTSLQMDLSVFFASKIRIEAPVPGKSCVGIEVPNETIEPVFIKEVLSSEEFRKKNWKIPIALGKDITGATIVGDLTKMPHLLVAGSTGSGKSVCMNCIIASILFRFSPAEVQMVMIDPKRVELSMYEGIPHLIDIKATPESKIVTDPKIAALVLQQMTEIMDRRYDEFKRMKTKNIFEYNEKTSSPLPYLLVFIDELADLMMVSSGGIETPICRIAQMGRAAGMHLVIATQRPTVNVLTGTIKVNVPSRIAFAVTAQIDSRTILDKAGAEELLGKGDMLYQPVDAGEPKRVQGAFISTEEIEKLVEFWQEQPPPDNMKPIDIAAPSAEKEEEKDSDEDSLYPEALNIIMAEKYASVSILQRKLKIGYARAGRIIDQMERRGVVGPAEGSKPRKILIGAAAAME